MGGKVPGPIGVQTTGSNLDDDTFARQRTNVPGPMSGPNSTFYNVPGPTLVGKPPRDPGKNPDGSVYEDMLNNDSPPQSISIKSDVLFGAATSVLEAMGRALIDSVSMGELNTVARRCWGRFLRGTGGIFTDSVLDEAVRNNDATKTFVRDFKDRLLPAIMNAKCNISTMTPLPLDNYSFDSLTDKAGGLGIIVHDWWSIKAEVTDYSGTWDNVTQKGAFLGKLVFTMTDDFALDWNDIVLHGNDHIPPTDSIFSTGDRFKAWYILQHWRPDHKPFFVQSSHTIDIKVNNSTRFGG